MGSMYASIIQDDNSHFFDRKGQFFKKINDKIGINGFCRCFKKELIAAR